MAQQPDITLYFLNSSRAIRVAWILEALNLNYKLVAADRAPNGLAPPEFRGKIPGKLRKSPTITDGGLVLQESQAILEFVKHICGQHTHLTNHAEKISVREIRYQPQIDPLRLPIQNQSSRVDVCQ